MGGAAGREEGRKMRCCCWKEKVASRRGAGAIGGLEGGGGRRPCGWVRCVARDISCCGDVSVDMCYLQRSESSVRDPGEHGRPAESPRDGRQAPGGGHARRHILMASPAWPPAKDNSYCPTCRRLRPWCPTLEPMPIPCAGSWCQFRMWPVPT